MLRILSFLALPFVLLGMLAAPLLGIHFCPQEAIPLLTLAGSLPFIGRPARALLDWVKSQVPSRGHCCKEEHQRPKQKPMTKAEALARIDAIIEQADTVVRRYGESAEVVHLEDVTPTPAAGPRKCEECAAVEARFKAGLEWPRGACSAHGPGQSPAKETT